MRRNRSSLLLLFFAVAVPGTAWGQVSRASDAGKTFELGKDSSLDAPPDRYPAVPVTNRERETIEVEALDLDLHIHSATSGVEASAVLQVRNVSIEPVRRIPLQISSSLRFLAVSLRSSRESTSLSFTQAPVTTDTDHTGYADEAVIALPGPLAPNATVTMMVLYEGKLEPSAARLELLGTPKEQSALSDWDAIAPNETALRGFGNVLWYPVAASTALFGEGNRLFQVVAEQRLRQARTAIRLRLTDEYQDDAPATAIFIDQAKPMTIVDRRDTSEASSSGLAQVEFASKPAGFNIPALFLIRQKAAPSAERLLSIFGANPESATELADDVALIKPLLSRWLGAEPDRSMIVLEHPGERFQQDSLLLDPLQAAGRTEQLEPSLIYGLSHTWFRSSQPWMEEGLSYFLTLLWMEQTQGREAVIGRLESDGNLIALAEPGLSSKVPEGEEPLIRASAPVFVRTKAAAVWWQLREMVGEDALRQAIQQCGQPNDGDIATFQHTLERVTKRDLSWFFDDWVYHDRSLPDLSIAGVSPRALPVRPGRPQGYLVAVEIRNEGAAVAEVPVVIRSGTLSASERVRVPGHGSASTRIIFEGVPESVQVNDGTVPELGAAIHTRGIAVPGGS